MRPKLASGAENRRFGSGKSRAEPEQRARVMTTLTSISLPAPAVGRDTPSRAFADLKSSWQRFFTRVFNPYRPELHYMRGPGPAWRAKYGEPVSFRLSSDLD
jgi:hypothetical protein